MGHYCPRDCPNPVPGEAHSWDMCDECRTAHEKCIGLLGRIFGHKFIDLVGNRSSHCMRCGYNPATSVQR